MDKLTRARRPVRIQLTRLTNELEAQLISDEVDKRAVQINFDLLLNVERELEALDEKIKDQMLDDGATDEAIEEEYKVIEKYKRSFLNIKADYDVMMCAGAKVNEETLSVAGSEGKKRKLHLPEVKQKKFGGDLKDWLGWWAHFEKIHLDEELHTSTKFEYLSQAMIEGSEAAALICSYPQTEGNYSKAVEALNERFGRQDLQLQVYVRELLTLVIANVTNPEKMPLAQLYGSLQSHLRSLATLNLDKADPATWLYPLVESSLSEGTLRAWQRSPSSKIDGQTMDPPKTKLDMLMDFIKVEVHSDQQIRLAQQGFQQVSHSNTLAKKKRERTGAAKKDEIPTIAGLVSIQGRNCNFCGQPHSTELCFKTMKLNMPEREQIVKEKRLCFRCLRGGHQKRLCKARVKCLSCGSGGHLKIMCRAIQPVPVSTNLDGNDRSEPPFKRAKTQHGGGNQTTSQVFTQSNNQCSGTVMLNTVKVQLVGKNGSLTWVRLFGDSGSQRSYITTNALTKSSSKHVGDEWLQNVVFGGGCSRPERVSRHQIKLIGLNGKEVILEVLEKKKITGDIGEIPPGEWLKEFQLQGVVFNDTGTVASEADILIGNDYWGNLRTGEMVKVPSGLVAENTVFGWTVGGSVTAAGYCVSTAPPHITKGNQELEKLWSFEAMGIRDSAEVQTTEEQEREAHKHFCKTVARDEKGRYIISLPWKLDREELPSNLQIARYRLDATTKKLKQNSKLETYHDVIKSWEEEGLVSVVEDSNNGHFIPHRAVFKDSSTTKCRPVFDCSCRAARRQSLNDCLYTGPNLIELIPVMMIRFGANEIGVSADIRKAFQMVKVREEDQPFQKFLWWKDLSCSQIVTYQHHRVVFGMTCSPFILGAVINYHLESYTGADESIAAILKKSFYVDNLLMSVKTSEELKFVREKAVRFLSEAKMELRQWAWNSTANLEREEESEDVVNVLGMKWNTSADLLSCVIQVDKEEEQVTKRGMLSAVAKIFDPMGYLSPALLLPKILVQQTWDQKVGWDTAVPADIEKKFRKWKKEVAELRGVSFPRFCQVPNAVSRDIHVFSDSSQDAMAAVVFLRTELYGAVEVQFLLAKSRVTPVKKPTIPRSELVSCVIGVRLARIVQRSLELGGDKFCYWTDSSTAWTWIRRDGNYGVFVLNRVKEIRESTTSKQWRHIPGSMNPADLPSRGCSPGTLKNNKWWEGPRWLYGPSTQFPRSLPMVDEEEVVKEVRKTVVTTLAVVPAAPRFSSYRKNVSLWAWVMRFIKNARIPREKRCLQPHVLLHELRKAEMCVIRKIQDESFPAGIEKVGGIQVGRDDNGLLRTKTKLSYRKDKNDFKFPILLPNKHPMVEQLIEGMHKLHGHGGIQFMLGKLREKYWVLQSRKAVRRVIKKCVTCRRFSSKPMEVLPAPLPAKRVEDGEIFQTVGVDLAGPLYLKEGKKAWIVLYTCAVYRAVHLDVVMSLSTEVFLRSLERFVSHYGRMNTLYSDNGTNFVGAANLFKMLSWKEVERDSNVKQIQWIFNPPTAAWYGGFWERLVRSVKDLLKRIIGKTKMCEDELRTCVAGVASTINDRPLTVVTEDGEDLVPLTPSMFIRPQKSGHMPELCEVKSLSESYQRMRRFLKRIQDRFRKEYLALLVTRGGRRQDAELREGDVVLVGFDNRKRYEWPLGIVTELCAGRDGVKRVAKVKTNHGIMTRPLQRLYPLEVSSSTHKIVTSEDLGGLRKNIPKKKAHVDPVTRSGRTSRHPVRYGQWNHLVYDSN